MLTFQKLYLNLYGETSSNQACGKNETVNPQHYNKKERRESKKKEKLQAALFSRPVIVVSEGSDS